MELHERTVIEEKRLNYIFSSSFLSIRMWEGLVGVECIVEIGTRNLDVVTNGESMEVLT